MAETLDINQMLANEYEPKRKFQWVVEIDGIDSFTAFSAARPKRNNEPVVIDYINQKRYVAGKTEFETFDLEFKDPIAPSQTQKLYQWLRLVHDTPTGRMGYASFYKKNFTLKMLDGPGNVVEKWNIIGAFPTAVDFGELNYGDNEVMTVKVTIRMDDCRLEF